MSRRWRSPVGSPTAAERARAELVAELATLRYPPHRISRVLDWLDYHGVLWDCPTLIPLDRELAQAILDRHRPMETVAVR